SACGHYSPRPAVAPNAGASPPHDQGRDAGERQRVCERGADWTRPMPASDAAGASQASAAPGPTCATVANRAHRPAVAGPRPGRWAVRLAAAQVVLLCGAAPTPTLPPQAGEGAGFRGGGAGFRSRAGWQGLLLPPLAGGR